MSSSNELIEEGSSNNEAQNSKSISNVPIRKSTRVISMRQGRLRLNKSQPPKAEYTKTWSDYEKQILLDLLYQYGDSDYELLASFLPNKHKTQIQTYLRTISRRANVIEKDRTKNKQIVQLDKWIELLKELSKDQPIDDSIPFELFASTKKISNLNVGQNEAVDFQKAYEYLSALSIGRKIDIDECTYYFILSYLDWFIKQFNKLVLNDGQTFITSALRKLNNNALTPLSVFQLLFHKTIPTEQYMQKKCLLKTACNKIRCNYFKKGEDYDRKVSLLRAELDEEIKLIEIYRNPPPCTIVPQCNDVIFKNLPSFVWAALFDIDVEEFNKTCKE